MTTEDLIGMGKALAPLTEGVSKLCSKLLSKPADKVGDFLAEWIDVRLRPWRLKNLLRSLQKTNEILDRRDIEPHPISNKLLSEFFDGASLEDDETLQKLWAGLLATALQGQETHPAYPSIIKQLTPNEAKILDYLFEQGLNISSNSPKISSYVEVPLAALLRLETMAESLLVVSTENLARLNLCTVDLVKPPVESFNEALGATPIRIVETLPKIQLPKSPFPGASLPYPEINNRKIQLSHLGNDFVKACNP